MNATDPNEYVEVYTASGALAGEMIRLMLEAKGIPVVLRQEAAGLIHGLTISPLGTVHVLVPPERVEEAEQLLQDMEDGRLVDTPLDMTGITEDDYVDDAYLSDGESSPEES